MSDPDHTVTALPLPAASSAAQSDFGHSDIFDRLSASNDGDLIGLMAYGLYQRRKRAWMEDFRATEGRYPNTKEKQAYAFSYRADAIEALRRDAEAIMAAFADQAIDQRIHEMRTDALAAETHQVITQIHRRLGEIGGYWHHIVGHLVG